MAKLIFTIMFHWSQLCGSRWPNSSSTSCCIEANSVEVDGQIHLHHHASSKPTLWQSMAKLIFTIMLHRSQLCGSRWPNSSSPSCFIEANSVAVDGQIHFHHHASSKPTLWQSMAKLIFTIMLHRSQPCVIRWPNSSSPSCCIEANPVSVDGQTHLHHHASSKPTLWQSMAKFIFTIMLHRSQLFDSRWPNSSSPSCFIEANSVAVDGETHLHHHASSKPMLWQSMAKLINTIMLHEAWWWWWAWPSTATELASNLLLLFTISNTLLHVGQYHSKLHNPRITTMFGICQNWSLLEMIETYSFLLFKASEHMCGWVLSHMANI